VPLERFFDGGLGISRAVEIDRPAKHHEGERRVVGDRPVVVEMKGFRCAARLASHGSNPFCFVGRTAVVTA
jgi:hypothetical protein